MLLTELYYVLISKASSSPAGSYGGPNPSVGMATYAWDEINILLKENRIQLRWSFSFPPPTKDVIRAMGISSSFVF